MAGRRWKAALLGLCLGAPGATGQEIPPAGLGVPRAGADPVPAVVAPAPALGALGVPSTPLPEEDGKKPPLPKEPANKQLPEKGEPPPDPGDKELSLYKIQLEPPGQDLLFRLESEQAIRKRILREEAARGNKVVFPDAPLPEPTLGLPWRTGALLFARAEPGYVCYRRTWFQQRNFERYGWEVGALTPGVCAGLFFVDVAALPLHWLVDPLRRHECSAGLCRPGDPVPMLWYPLGTK